MKLEEYLREKRWNTSIFSRESKVDIVTLRKIVNGKGSINLDTALQIEIATNGKVRTWDLSLNADLIKKGSWKRPKRATKDSAQEKNNENEENKNADIEIENV